MLDAGCAPHIDISTMPMRVTRRRSHSPNIANIYHIHIYIRDMDMAHGGTNMAHAGMTPPPRRYTPLALQRYRFYIYGGRYRVSQCVLYTIYYKKSIS